MGGLKQSNLDDWKVDSQFSKVFFPNTMLDVGLWCEGDMNVV